MIDNKYILDLVNFIANKTQQGNTVSPAEFNTLLQSGNMKLFKMKTGVSEEYKIGQPFTKQSAEITQKNTDDLIPFKVWMGSVNTPPLFIDANGNAPIPTGFYYPLGLSYKNVKNNDCDVLDFNLVPIDIVTDNQWITVSTHSIRYPRKEYPIANFQNGYIRFLPKDLRFADFNYLRFPVAPIYDYYISAVGEFIYLPVGVSHTLTVGEEGSNGQTLQTVTSHSVELEWNDMVKLDIVPLILSAIGVNLREGQLSQYAEQKTMQGV